MFTDSVRAPARYRMAVRYEVTGQFEDVFFFC